jgi:hypothetical protein
MAPALGRVRMAWKRRDVRAARRRARWVARGERWAALVEQGVGAAMSAVGPVARRCGARSDGPAQLSEDEERVDV